ncbi:MAG: hypothetical protein J6J42_10430 [Lachnospiraceae bacterium]|nr:hypothetical protein [Lachnospiraceae bacterium]
MEKLIKSKVLLGIILVEFIYIGAYLTASLFRKHAGWLNGLIAILILYAVSAVVWVKVKHRKAPGWWCFYKSAGYIMTGYAAIFATGVLVYGVNFFADTYLKESGRKYYTASEAEMIVVEAKGKSILEHLDLLTNLKPDIYRTLEIQEKVDVLNRVVQIEAEYLGIEAPVLQVTALESNVVGRYVQQRNVILLSEAYLPYEETILTGVLHEMYHAYQYACVSAVEEESDLLFFRQVEQWRAEYEDIKGDTGTKEGHLSYYMQDIEISARKYAEERLSEYGKIIVIGNMP